MNATIAAETLSDRADFENGIEQRGYAPLYIPHFSGRGQMAVGQQ